MSDNSPDSDWFTDEPIWPAPPAPPTASLEPQVGATPGTVVSRHWLVVIALTILAAAASVGVSIATWDTAYDASVLVRVGRPGVFGEQFTDPAYVERILGSVANLSTDQSIEEATWATAQDPYESALSVEIIRETELLRFNVRAGDERTALATLSAFLLEAERAVTHVYGDDLAFVTASRKPDVKEASAPMIARGVLGAAAGALIGIAVAAVLDKRR